MSTGPDFSSMTDTQLAGYKSALDKEIALRQTVTVERVTAVRDKAQELYGIDPPLVNVRRILAAVTEIDSAGTR